MSINISTAEQLYNFLTQPTEILSNINININKPIDMKKYKNIINKSFILDKVIINGNNRIISNLNLINPLFKNINKNSIIQYINLNKINNIFVDKNEGLINECILDNIYANNKNINSFMVSENNGIIKNSTIINSYIIHYSPNNIVMGLLCGINNNIIENCSSKNNFITNKMFVAGGLVGINKGSINKCYVEYLNNKSLFAGGLVGDIYSNSNINNCQVNFITLNNNQTSNNGIIFIRAMNNIFNISCIKINSKVFDKYINNDIMNNYTNNIKNIQVNDIYNNKFNLDINNLCFSEMKIRKDLFENTNIKNNNMLIYFIIFILLICAGIYISRCRNKL